MAFVVKVLVCCFLLSGLFGSDEYDAEKIADIFYTLNGDSSDPHKKINHAKGFCATGEFFPNKSLSIDVPLLKKDYINAEVRYSLGGALLDDRSKVRGMALRLLGGDSQWTMVMLNTEINFAKNPQEFGQFFEMRIPVNGKVDTKKIAKLTKEVDSYRNFEAYTSKMGISKLENTPYYSIHTFMFNKNGKTYPAKFKFVPKDGIKYLSEDEIANLDKDFLLSTFQSYIAKKPMEYDMYLVYANDNDVINDTTALWEGEHKEEYVGTLKVAKYAGDNCNGDVYFPSDLPLGVNPPNDPLFDLRNTTYGITFGRRQ